MNSIFGHCEYWCNNRKTLEYASINLKQSKHCNVSFTLCFWKALLWKLRASSFVRLCKMWTSEKKKSLNIPSSSRYRLPFLRCEGLLPCTVVLDNTRQPLGVKWFEDIPVWINRWMSHWTLLLAVELGVYRNLVAVIFYSSERQFRWFSSTLRHDLLLEAIVGSLAEHT